MAEETNPDQSSESTEPQDADAAADATPESSAPAAPVKEEEATIAHAITGESKLPNSILEITLEIPREEWDKRIEKLLKEWQHDTTLEGFRKGKAPMRLIQRRFTKEVKDGVIEAAVPKIIEDFSTEKKLTIFGSPAVKEIKDEAGQPVVLVIDLEIKPEIDPKEYAGQDIEVPAYQVTEEMIQNRLERIRTQNSTWEGVAGEFSGDMAVVLDYKIVDQRGQTVDQQTNKLFEDPRRSLPPALPKAIEGMKAGDTLDLRIPNPNKPGEALHCVGELKAVKEKKLPAVDDELAKDLDFASLDAMRESLRAEEQVFVDQINADESFDILINKILEANPFDVPTGLVRKVEYDMLDADINYMHRTGFAPPRVAGHTKEQYRGLIGENADKRVKMVILLDAIAKKEDIQVNDDDINAALEVRAKEQGRKAVAIRASLERKKELGHFAENVRMNKIRTFLLAKTNIKYVERKTETTDAVTPEKDEPSPTA